MFKWLESNRDIPDEPVSDYWKGYNRGNKIGFLFGFLFTLVLYSALIVLWTGIRLVI